MRVKVVQVDRGLHSAIRRRLTAKAEDLHCLSEGQRREKEIGIEKKDTMTATVKKLAD